MSSSSVQMKVLLVEDDADHADLIRFHLAHKRAESVAIQWVKSLAECFATLKSDEQVEAILLDLGLPDSSVKTTLSRVLDFTRGIPIVVLSSLEDEDFAIKAVHEGAQDYICKSQLDGELLFRSLRYAIERKTSEAEIKKARDDADIANRAKSAFLANMSHEIRTPLNAIIGFTELLRNPSFGETERLGFISTIGRNGKLLTQLIDDILDLSKVEAGKLVIEYETCSLQLIISDITELLSNQAVEKGIFLRISSEDEIPETISADPMRLKQILINIIGNAIKFTKAGGVTVNVRYIDALESKIEFVVTDTGRGIAIEYQGSLFRPFTQGDNSTTRKFGGSGLGLVLARRLAQALGGDVELIESEPGKGSVFSVSIVAKDAQGKCRIGASEQAFIDPTVSPHPSILRDLKILIVEDAPDNQALMAQILLNQGAHIFLAENGDVAIEMVLKHSFDIVLMDLQMPVRDGFEATMELRKLGYKGPILAVSAAAMKEERNRALSVGCDDHLTKPISMESLVEKVADFTLRRSCDVLHA